MGFNTDRENIEQFLSDNLSYALRFEGHDYENDNTFPFVGVMINPVVRENATIDSLNKNVTGFIRLRVFTEMSAGTKQVLDVCDELAVLMDNQVIGTVTTRAAEAPETLKTEKTYLAKEIEIPYYSN